MASPHHHQPAQNDDEPGPALHVPWAAGVPPEAVQAALGPEPVQDDEARPHPALRQRLRPHLEEVPEPAHAILAAYLPDGDEAKKGTRRRLAILSSRMHEHYARTLTKLDVQWRGHHQVSALVSLVELQHRLKKLTANKGEAFPPLITILRAPRCLPRLQELLELHVVLPKVKNRHHAQSHVAMLVEALEVLTKLEVLHVSPSPTDGWWVDSLPLLARALDSETVPALRVLGLGFGPNNDEEVEALAAMLEGRALLEKCRPLERLLAAWLLDPKTLEGARCRLLRALLQSVSELEDELLWQPAYDACFVEVRALYLKALTLRGDAPLPSRQAWEAMPALEKVAFCGQRKDRRPTLYTHHVIAAVSGGVAFQHLRSLHVAFLSIPSNQWVLLLHALANSTCSTQLSSLELYATDFCSSAMRTLSLLVGNDSFPSLQKLSLAASADIGDDDVVVLAQGLLKGHTRLALVDLTHVGMGVKGMAALAAVVCTGRLERLYLKDNLVMGDGDDVGGGGGGNSPMYSPSAMDEGAEESKQA